MADWAPSSPETIGLEWFPTTEGVTTIDSGVAAAAVSIEQTTSEIISEVRVAVGNIGIGGGLYAVEVYDDENAVIPVDEFAVGPDGEVIGVGIYPVWTRPNEDVSVGSWTNELGSGTNVYASMRDDDIATYAQAPATTTWYEYEGRFDTATLSLTGKRILGVQLDLLTVIVENGAVVAGLRVGSETYAPIVITNTGLGGAVSSWMWPYNPVTDAPWTIADVLAFDSTSKWVMSAFGYYTATIHVHEVVLKVAMCDENRLAVGVLNDLGGQEGGTPALIPNAWNAAAMTTPTGGAWTKSDTGRHLYVVRRLNTFGAMSLPSLSALDGPPPPATGWAPKLEPLYGAAIDMRDPVNRVIGVVPVTTGAVQSVDSQPYRRLMTAMINADETAEFEASGTATTYGRVRLALQVGDAVEPLTVSLDRRGVGLTGATLSISPSDLSDGDDIGNGWTLVTGQLTPILPTVANAQYGVILSTEDTSETGWATLLISTEGIGNAATAGGTTDQGTARPDEPDWLVAGTQSADWDVLGTLATFPSAPTDITGDLLDQGRDGAVCGQETIPYVSLGWVTTGTPNFAYYQIQRSEGGGAWETVALLTTQQSSASGGLLTSAGGASTPDSAELAILGDLDVRALFSSNDIEALDQTIAGQWGDAGNRSWRFLVSGGFLVFEYSLDGTTVLTKTCTLPLSAIDIFSGDAFYARVVQDVDNGAGGSSVIFYSSDDGAVWSQFGATITTVGPGISRFNSTADFTVGCVDATPADRLDGQVALVEFLDSIDGGAITAPVFTDHCGAASFEEGGEVYLLDEDGVIITTPADVPIEADGYASSTARTWTVLGSSEIVCTPERFGDYEARVGVEACYRIRVIRNDGAISAWSDEICTTRTVDCPVLLLTSNYEPSYNAVYDWDGEPEYEFLESGEQVYQGIYGADGSLAFNPIERRGVRIRYRVHAAIDGVPGYGQAAFAPLRELALAQIPYVAVIDHQGNRLKAHLRVPSGNGQTSFSYAIAEVLATEVADRTTLVV
jgi:hypothetical protein